LTTLTLGIVGCGKIARAQHLPAIAATDGLILAAIADPFATHETLPSYPDVDAMLAAHPEITAVALCQPPQARFAAARAAIRAGRHVLLEKPPGASLSDAEALIAMAREAGVTLFAAWHSREGAGVAKARQWIAGKTLRAVTIIWKEDIRVWHPGQLWITQPGGFGVFDPGINALSILTAILPEPVRLTNAALQVPVNWQAPIAAQLDMATGDDVPIRAEFDFRQTGRQSWDIRVEALEGVLELTNGGNSLSIDGSAINCAPEGEYAALYRHFAQLIAHRHSDVDIAPLRLVADAFLRGQMTATEAFFV
jgi:D-galactose 1-dehydrogenase